MARFVTLWLCLAVIPAYCDTRVSLVSTCSGDASKDVLALATARLSGEPGIALVERAEVERVLQEHALWQCGLGEVEQALAAGKFLGVEVFATLEMSPGSEAALGLVVFDAGTGVRLGDDTLPKAGVEATVERIVFSLENAIQKRQHAAGVVRTVCLLTVRNTDLPRELDSFCQSLGVLLERQLLNSPNLTVLERRHLEQVNRERSLPGLSPAGDLYPSLNILEIEVSRGANPAGIQAVALISDGAGKRTARTSAAVDRRDLAELAQRFLTEITKVLDAAPPAKGADRAREAERFLRESDYLRNQREKTRALQWVEAAAALDPENLDAVNALGLGLSEHAVDLMRTNADYDETLDIALRALEVSTDVRQRRLVKDGRVDVEGPEEPLLGERFWMSAVRRAGPRSKLRLLELQSGLRRLELDLVLENSRDPHNDRPAFWSYSGLCNQLQGKMEALSPSTEAWIAGTAKIIENWMKVADVHHISRNWSLHAVRLLARLCVQAKGPFKEFIPHVNNWSMQDADFQRLRPTFQQMQQHLDPVVRIYGMTGELALDLRGQSSLTAAHRQRYDQIRDVIRQELRKPTREPATTTRSNGYGAALDLIDLVFDDPAERRREYLDLFAFMVEQKHCAYWPIVMVSDPDAHTYRHFYSPLNDSPWQRDVFSRSPAGWRTEDYPSLAGNLDRAMTLERSTDCVEVDCGLWSFKTGSPQRDFAEVKKKLYAGHPELATKEPPVPWTTAKVLFETAQHTIRTVCLEGDLIYAPLLGGDGTLRIMKIPRDGTPTPLPGHVDLPGRKVTCAVVHENKMYVGTDSAGICVFPTESSDVERITTTDGLPAGSVDALAVAVAKLYIGMEGYLAAFDFKTRRCDLLASSRRKDKKSPFDDLSPPLQVSAMLADAPQHRVLFLATRYGGECDPLLGLWQIDTATSELSQVLQFDRNPHWMQRDVDGHVWIFFSGFRDMIYSPERGACSAPALGLVRFDPATNRGQLLYGWTVKGFPVNAVGPKLPGGDRVITLPMGMQPPFVLLDDWLWFNEGRISPGGTIENFATSNWNTLHILGRQVVATDTQHVWLLTMPAKEKPRSIVIPSERYE